VRRPAIGAGLVLGHAAKCMGRDRIIGA
jgi:hypothetical protein